MSVLEYASPAPRTKLGFQWILWAVYLGMSWTWCIGMFLPVLLVHQFDLWAWVVFAIPNVVGAAAMGWTISRETGVSILGNHARAVSAFSTVTISFQLFFALWIFRNFGAFGLRAWPFFVALFGPVFILSVPRRFSFLLAVAVFAGSLACLVKLALVGDLGIGDPAGLLRVDQASDVFGLTTVCSFGFALCPYLDGTFLAARARLSRNASRAAFGVGFGIFFFSMIVFTLFYARPVWALRAYLFPHTAALIATMLGTHWAIQLGYTVGVHTSSILSIGTPRSTTIRNLFLAPAAAVAAFTLTLLIRWSDHYAMETGELIYRLFMSFYGLIFPAYVWLCMIPTRGRAKPSLWSLKVFAVTCVLAAPMYWMGFIEKKMLWLIPGVALVLIARVLVPRREDVNVRLDPAQQNSAPIS